MAFLQYGLAVNLDPADRTGDRERLLADEWCIVDPHVVAGSPAGNQRHLAASRAGLACPKPIHRALRTGWFIDRSGAYLTSGRPVVFEDTGLADRLSSGDGLLLFCDEMEAASAVAEIDGDTARHSRSARARRGRVRRAALPAGDAGGLGGAPVGDVKARVVVLGAVARMPVAGVAWQGLHYVEGLRRLGHDVHYVEDTNDWAYDPERRTLANDGAHPARYLGRLMGWLGLPDRWAYRVAGDDGAVHGLSRTAFRALFARADALLNVTGATTLREEHLCVPVRAYIETDPVVPQLEIAQGRRSTRDFLAAHTHHFSFGENLGTPRCPIPVEPFRYRPTRQPVVRDWWPPSARPAAVPPRFTTIANWQQTGKDVAWRGDVYTWSKHREFLRLLDLPARTRVGLELTLAGGDAATRATLAAHGWRLGDAGAISDDILPYRDYVLGSDGEFTVAKDQNVRLRSGWFSDRSACYLAAGKPVVTQDTGFGDVLPTGRGLFAFRSVEDAAAALDAIAADPGGHARAAAEVAEECFDAERVLRRLLADVGL